MFAKTMMWIKACGARTVAMRAIGVRDGMADVVPDYLRSNCAMVSAMLA